jgi:autoinducer 2 (AI-2) kinase
MPRSFLVFDAGTGAGRALIIDQFGEIKSNIYREWSHKEDVGVSGGAVFDPKDLETALIESGRKAYVNAKIRPEEISAVISTSLREGVVFLGKEKQELYVGPNFDERALEEGRILADLFGEDIYYTTGTYPPAYGYGARLSWFEKHRPTVISDIWKILTLGDWITWKLSGCIVAEPSLASASGLFNVSAGDWSLSLANKLGVDMKLLPAISPAGEQVGPMKHDFAQYLGLSPNVQVLIGGGDTQCAMLGMGLYKPGQVGCVAGTTSPIQLLTATPIFDKRMRTWTNCHLVREVWCLESNAIVTGLAFRGIRDSLCKGLSFQKMNTLVESSPVGSRGLVAFLGAEIMDMSKYRSSWLGGFLFQVPLGGNNLGDYVRAAVESNAYAVKGNLEQLMEISGDSFDELHVCGGQTASFVNMQILADVLGIPVHIHGSQCSSLGAAICAAVGTGVYSSHEEAISNMVPDSLTLEPRSEIFKLYQQFYRRWRTYYDQVRKLSI